MCDITELLSVGSLCGAGVRQSGGCWKAVGGSRKLYGQMLPVRTGSPLCSSPLYIAAGVSAVCLSVRSSGGKGLVEVSEITSLTLLTHGWV